MDRLKMDFSGAPVEFRKSSLQPGDCEPEMIYFTKAVTKRGSALFLLRPGEARIPVEDHKIQQCLIETLKPERNPDS